MRSVVDAVAAHQAVATYGDNPSGFLALNSGNQYFTVPGRDGLIAYRPSGRYLIQFAGPFAPRDDHPALLREFLRFAGDQRRRVLAVQLQRADTENYAAHGFTVNQLGASYAVELAGFTLSGGPFMRLRNKISRARRSGLVIEEVRPTQYEPRLADLDRQWLRGKGRHVRPLQFLVGERDGPLADHRRLFVGRIDSVLIGYISYSPVTVNRPGWLHDLSRRLPDAPPGTMEAVNLTAIERFRDEGAAWLHFGFTPFTSLDPGLEAASASRVVARLVRLLADHGEFVYPARTQLAYKEKWGPHAVLPEYIAFQGRPRAGAVWQLLRTANVF
jgi:lysylphosphatidylglycerol synthetase-like protein (DUF2156 family)